MKSNITVNLFTLIFLFFTHTFYASVYYVDNSLGDDAFVGTEIQPWKTIQKATNTLVAGDTVYIKAGTYTPLQKIEFLNSGTVGNYISYLAYPGDEQLVVIDGANIVLPNWFGVITVDSKAYIKISGLKIINSSYAGIFVDTSSNILIENNFTFETKSSGISVWSSDMVVVDNNKVSRACWPTGGEQECVSIVKSNRVIVKNNEVFDGGSIGFGGGGEGIDFKDGCTNGVVFNNIVHDIASVGIYIDAYLTDQSNIHVLNNTVYNIYGVGIATVSEEGGALDSVIVSQNRVYNCNDRCMVVHWTAKPDYVIKNIYVHHNTFYNNAEGLDIGIHTQGKNINVTNNIFSQNNIYQMQYSSNDLDTNELHITHNLLDGNTPSWSLFGSNYLLSPPNFVDTLNYDFHLKNNSLAIDQGTYLAKTINSGSGTVLQLDNVGFFTNNYGLQVGDSITIEGQNQTFEVVEVDPINSTITLNASITWGNDVGVSILFNNTFPDIGAYEYVDYSNIEFLDSHHFVVFPNPTKDVLILPELYLNSYYQLISFKGNIVKSGIITTTQLNVQDLKPGLYILKLIHSKTQKTSFAKVVVE